GHLLVRHGLRSDHGLPVARHERRGGDRDGGSLPRLPHDAHAHRGRARRALSVGGLAYDRRMESTFLGPFHVEIARTHSERRRGLTGRAHLEPGAGMLFPRARAIHTFGMRFPITVAFLDREHRAIGVKRVPPSRLAWNPRARHVLELE